MPKELPKTEELDPATRERLALLDIQEGHSKVLFESGMAAKAFAVLRKEREEYVKECEERGVEPISDAIPDLSNPATRAVVKLVKQNYVKAEGGTVLLEKPSVVFLTPFINARGELTSLQHPPVSVAESYQGVGHPVNNFTDQDSAVLTGLMETLKMANQQGILPHLGDDLLTLAIPAESPDTSQKH